MKKISFFLILCLLSAAPVLAATFNMTVTRPICSSGWNVSGNVYTCPSASIALASGDIIVSGSGGAITVIAEGGITLAGGNTIGSASAPVNLQTTYGNLSANGSAKVIYGNVVTGSGAVSLTNTTLNGSISTNGTATLSGGSVSGNVTAANGVTSTNGTTIGGNVLATSGAISLNGGSVAGSVGSNCCTVSTTNTDVDNGVSSGNNTVTINGGTINGSISSNGGGGVNISNATVASGSISAGTVPIFISNSTIGSSAGNVNVTGSNTVTISNGSTVYGSVTSGNWAAALNVDNSSFIFGTCTSSSNSVSNPPQYPRCSGAVLLAEWRMDETSWDANDNTVEVKDSVGSRHGSAAIAVNGGARPITATGSAAYTSANGGLSTCRYGQFDRTSNPTRRYGYIQLSSFPTLPAQFTFAGWIRTTDRSVAGQRILVNDDNQDGWALSLGDAGDGMVRFFNRNLRRTGNITGSGSNSACGTNAGDPFCLDTIATISNNTWYFVAVAVDTATKRITLYVFNQDGSLRTQVSSAYTGNWANGSGAVSIGGESSASSEGQDADFHFKGNLDEIKVYGMALNESALQAELTRARSCTASVNHIRIRHDGEGLTCSPELVIVEACADANCTSLYAGQVTLNLAPGGAGITFTGSTTTALVSRTTVGQATLAATDVNPGVTGATRCFNGTTETCLMNFVDSGFLVNVPPHAAETSQPISIKAVKKADSGVACVPAFASVSRAVNLRCGYVNPVAGAITGQVPVRINDAALNAAGSASSVCDTGGASVSLNFDATGTATPTLKYADVGEMTLVVSHTLATSNDMTGSANFIVAPASFVFDTITASPIRAGNAFSAQVSARNALGNVTPSFSRESAPETVELKSVTLAAASAANSQLVGPTDGATGTLTNGTFGLFARTTCSPLSNGAVCSQTLAWTEVGDVNLVAAGKSVNGYLGSGLKPWGMASARFIPAYFETAFDPAAPCGAFTYSGQPFRLLVTAKSAANAALGLPSSSTTLNYKGSYARNVTLGRDEAASCTPNTTGFANNALAATAFSNGEARTPVITNTTAPLPVSFAHSTSTGATTCASGSTTVCRPSTLTVCARDTDGVNSHGQTQAVTEIRSGRLRLSNAFGSEKQVLRMPIQTHYWSGNTWLPNSADSCTRLVAGNFYKSSAISNITNTPEVEIINGMGNLILSAPGAGVTGSMDIAANLGSSGNDVSCLAGHGGTPGNRPWLRSRNGNCAATYDRDPSARATFGIYSPERRRVIHVRELF